MGLATIGALAGLALVDSTSIGTLVLPLVMLLRPRVDTRRVLLYLATIGVFYWALGLGLAAGFGSLRARSAALEGNRTVDWVQLVVGAAMLVGSFWPDTPWAKRRAAAAGAGVRRGRWRSALGGEGTSAGRIVVIALMAGLIEAASMLPYLGAVGLVSTSGLGAPAQAGVLAAYVVVMTLPALALLGLRLGLGHRVEPTLERIDAWFATHTGGAIWWVVGILGFLVTADAVTRLGLTPH